MSVPTKFYTYTRALASKSRYAQQMKLLQNSIFGEVTRPTSKSSMRVVTHFAKRPYEQRKEIVEYYPAHEETTTLMTELRNYGLYRDESKDIQDMIAKFRRLRGKEKIQWTAAGRKEKVAATGGGKKRKK